MEEVGVATPQSFLLHSPLHEQSVSMATLQSSVQTSTESPMFSPSLLPYCSVLLPERASPPPPPPSSHLPSPSATGHRSYTLEFKLSVVDWIQSTKASIRAASKQFGVDRKLIRTWLHSRDALSSALAVHGPNRRKLHSGARPLSEAVDQHVLQFLHQRRQAGVQVVERDLQLEALEYAKSLGLSTFKATSTWVRGWKHRHGVEWRNGSYEIVEKTAASGKMNCNVHAEVKGSALLSHVNAHDRVKVPAAAKSIGGCDQVAEGERDGRLETATSYAVEGTVELDYSAKEHSYAKPARLAPPSLATPPPSLVTPPPPSIFTSAAILDQSCLLSSLSPLTSHLDSPPATYEPFEMDGVMVGDVSALELPLGHEEVVTDSDLLLPLASRAKRQAGSPRRASRGRGKGRRTGVSVSPTSVATFPGVDEGGGLGVMLANRLSQPVFPAGPEIVYIDAPMTALATTGHSS